MSELWAQTQIKWWTVHFVEEEKILKEKLYCQAYFQCKGIIFLAFGDIIKTPRTKLSVLLLLLLLLLLQDCRL